MSASPIWFFLLFYGALAAGLPLRRFGAHAPRVMRANILVVETPVFVYALWALDLAQLERYAPVPLGSVGLILLLGALARAWARRLWPGAPRARGSFVIASAFSNIGNTGGMFLCYLLFGTTGLSLASLFLVPYPLLIFTLGFAAARTYADGKRPRPVEALRHLATNRIAVMPLGAMILGLILNLLGLPLPEGLAGVVDVLIKINIAVACLAIGATLRPGHLFTPWRPVAALSALKFVVAPAAALAVALLAYGGLGPLPARVLLIQSAMPAAVYSVITATLFGLDRDLANTLWLSTTLLLAPLALLLFALFG